MSNFNTNDEMLGTVSDTSVDTNSDNIHLNNLTMTSDNNIDVSALTATTMLSDMSTTSNERSSTTTITANNPVAAQETNLLSIITSSPTEPAIIMATSIEALTATSTEPLKAISGTTTPTTATMTATPTTTPTATMTTSTTQTTSTTTTTSTSSTPSRFAAKRPQNLNLKVLATKLMPSISNENGSATISTTDSSSAQRATFTSTSESTPKSTSTTSSSVFPHEQHNRMKKLDVGFDNISFSVKTGIFKRENKEILKSVSGKFRSGELSAIVGPSGAGKTTLVNILSSYTARGYSGSVTVNGCIRDIKAFKANMAFITQDASLQPHLTVKEAMHFSANLKIGTDMSQSEKRERVRKILEAIGLYENRHTRTGKLSGGQKKRLAIALELVNNPPVLILDEPTSGLDSFTSNQCISILKKLAMEGRTVICTIHQPSALTFQMMDHLYALAEGQCIYSGGTQNLVPFLADTGLQCPESYNPADYLMEIATNDYGKLNQKLMEKMENGRNDSFRQGSSDKKLQMKAIKKIDNMMASGLMTPVTAPVLTPAIIAVSKTAPMSHAKQLTPINEMSSKIWDSCGVQTGSNTKESKLHKPQLDPTKLCKRENVYATPFYRQLGILLVRSFLILWRDKSLTLMRVSIHLITALLIGFIYYGIGNDAGNALNNFRYIFYTIMFIMYCSFSSILVKFPLEFPIVSREHFNRWYSLRAYYVAMTLADIPIQLICTAIFVGITYVMTNQPWQLFRLLLFSLMVLLTALVGQSIGLCVGASLNVKLGAILGPFFICPFLQFSGFFLQLKDSPVYFHGLFYISFLKHSFDGSMLAIFGYDRARLECSDIYCHYSRPKAFLKDMDMSNANYELSFMVLFVIFICLRIISFYIMSFRLRLFR